MTSPGKPTYQLIYDDLRTKILDGAIASGEQLPSIRDLAATWNTHTATVQKAITALHHEGLTVAQHGKGTFAAPDGAHRTAHDRLRSAQTTGRIYPANEYARILAAELTTATDTVAAALGIEAGAVVIRRKRVTLNRDTDQPVSASTSYLPGTLAAACPALLAAERLPEGTPAYIEQATGRAVTAGREQHSADTATDDDRALLGVATGSPLMRGRNWMYDTAGDVIEYGESIAAPGRWSTHTYEIASRTGN